MNQRSPLIISVDRNTCMGAGECVHAAPHTFQLDAHRRSVVIDPVGDEDEAIQDAAMMCPNFAITIDQSTREGQ